jgi:hypothetical protein
MLRLLLCLCAGALLASVPATAGTSPLPQRAVVVQQGYYPYQRYGWRPADPSFDQDGRPYRNPFPGQCMVDLGYGRWESCDQVGGR